jgi:hypothetical protein
MYGDSDMPWKHVTPESQAALHRLRDETRSSGDDTFNTLLSGLELYIALGREFELLEHMLQIDEEMRDSVENTPTASDLERLYRAEEPE